MGVRKRDRVSPQLQFYSALPADDEPEYKSGFDCDACGEGFAVGPFFHCTLTGTDQCMRCSVRSGLHAAPAPVVELFVRARSIAETTNEVLSNSTLSASQTATTAMPPPRPVLAYRTCDRDVGVLLSDGSCLFLEITSYAVNRGWIRSVDGEVETIDDGADIGARFPWVEEWGNPLTLNDQHLFIAKRWGRLPSKSSVEWKHVIFVKRWDAAAATSSANARTTTSAIGSGCDVLSTTDATGGEYIAVLDAAHQCYSFWWLTGNKYRSTAAAASSPTAQGKKQHLSGSANSKHQLAPEAWTLLIGRSLDNHIMTFWGQSLMRGLQTLQNSNLFFVDAAPSAAPSAATLKYE